MPLYLFSCCDKEYEVIQGRDEDFPICHYCGAKMKKTPSSPAIITIRGEGRAPTHSKGYKEDYAKEYKRRLQEAKS